VFLLLHIDNTQKYQLWKNNCVAAKKIFPDIIYKMSFTDMCVPAQLYAVFSFIIIVWLVYLKQYGGVISKAIFAIIWTFVLSFLCDNGYAGLSWFLLVLPMVLIVLLILLVFVLFKSVVDKLEPGKINVTETKQITL
jgi:hypothetical protein